MASPVSQAATGPFVYTFTKQLTFNGTANDPAELQNLQGALQHLGYMTKGVYGPFGAQTKAALGAFQTAHGIQDVDGQGTDFGPSSRAALNAALLAAH